MKNYVASTLPGSQGEFDQALFWISILLLAFGLVMVYSSSIAIAEADVHTGNQPNYFLIRDAAYIGAGLIAGLFSFQISLNNWQKFSPYLFALGLILLVLVLIPGIGREVNGSQRWLSLLVVNFQPSEIMKFFVVLYAADYSVRKAQFMQSFTKAFLPMLFVMMLVGWLLLREPDFGALAVITTIAMTILFLGGINLKPFAGLIVLLIGGFLMLVWTSPYRLQRVIGFMDPWADPFGKGYQLSHALIAFGRGELWGVGLGASVEKLLYLPEAHTDFLLAVIAEELGFIGVTLLILIFAWLIARAFAIGTRATQQGRYFSGLVAQGIAVWLGTQALINMGVNMGLLPTKGLTLPLLSFGGSGIAVNCIAISVLLRIDWETRQLTKGYAV